MQELNQSLIDTSIDKLKTKTVFINLQKITSKVIEIKNLTKKTMYFFPLVIIVWIFCALVIGISFLVFPRDKNFDIFSLYFTFPIFVVMGLVAFSSVTSFIKLRRKNYHSINSKLDSILKLDDRNFEINNVMQEYKVKAKLLLQQHRLKKIVQLLQQKIVFLKAKIKQFNNNSVDSIANNIHLKKEKITKILKKVKKIKTIAKVAITMNIVSYFCFLIIIILVITRNTHPANNGVSLVNLGIFIDVAVYVLAGFVGNIAFLSLIIFDLNLISTFEIKNKEFKININSYKKTIKTLSIIAFFVFSFIFLIVIWLICKSKEKFLENKITKLKKNNVNNLNN